MSISNHSMAASYPLAAHASRQGKYLDVAPHTALASLTQCCDTLGDRAFVDEAGNTPFATEDLKPADIVLAAAAEESLEGVNDHGLQMDEIVERASHATNFAFDFTRNVVNPQVATVVEATQAYVESVTKKRLEPLVIEPVFNGRLFDTTALQELIAPFKDASLSNVAPKKLTVVWPEDGLRAALRTGDHELDTAVHNHFAEREADVASLWKRYFADEPGNYRPQDMMAAPLNSDDSLVLFLGAHSLLESDHVPEGLDIDLPSYRTYLAQLREQAGARISYLYQQNANRAKVKQLVINAPIKPAKGGIPTGKITVAGDVYNNWLKDGGSPEALYQAVHEGVTLQYDVLLQDAPGLAKRWLTTMGILETQRKFERQTAITTGLRAAVYKLYLSLNDSLKDFVPYATDGEFLSALSERLSHFHVKDLDDLYIVARKAVCRVLYPQTHAEKILNAMDSVMKDNPEYSPREAAFFVMIDYVTEWVTDAIVLKTIAPGAVSANT